MRPLSQSDDNIISTAKEHLWCAGNILERGGSLEATIFQCFSAVVTLLIGIFIKLAEKH